jgi:hypothetical protein
MNPPGSANFLAGVVEGFYGPPWSYEERGQLFRQMQAGGLNTYIYAPKDDLHHRAHWREPYSAGEGLRLAALIRAAQVHGIRFVYALSPGLDLRYGEPGDEHALQCRFAQLLALGCEHFALLFDDLPDRFDTGSMALAHCATANTVFRFLREQRASAQLAFCPTPYCGRMAASGVGEPDYLATVGRELAPEIDVFWTGPEIISREITVDHVRELQTLLRRKPLIWDNLHANDYDGRRFFCGPYSGRSAEICREVRGLIVNPNCEFPLNFVPLHTFASFVRGAGLDARAAFLAALRAWWPSFATMGAPLGWEEFVVFCDCYYLPHTDGPEAETLFRRIQGAIGSKPAPGVRVSIRRLRDFCGRLTELKDRPLFYALSRRAWELREELDLLDRYLASADGAVASDFHLPGTYRGGFVPRLQQLLVAKPDGSFAPPS